MINSSDFNGLKDFYKAVCNHQGFTDAFIEVVTDFKTSKYFTLEQTDEIADYVKLQSDAGHQVFFGPALRKEDLGYKRSNDENILYMLSLWVDIDSPDKSLPADQRLEQAQILLSEFIVALMEYNIEPSFIVESGHGYHVYILVRQALVHPNDSWVNVQIALINMAKADMQVTLGVINTGRSERLKMSPQRLGKIVRRLGFNPYNQGSLRGIYIDQQLLERLCRRYGIRMKEIVQAV